MKLSEIIKNAVHNSPEKHCACEGHSHCGCGHDDVYESLTHGKFDSVLAARLVISALLFAAGIIIPMSETAGLAFLILAALVAGYDVVLDAVKRIMRLRAFDENVLMTVAAIAAFIVGESHEGAAVLILFQCGELLQGYAVGRARQSVAESLDSRAEAVTVIRGGKEFEVGVENVAVGETVVIHPGERISFDSVVQSGESTIDVSALTGESLPLNVQAGDSLLSGAINLTGVLYTEVRSLAGDSTAARILNMVQNESSKKGETEKFITKFAAIYTPVVLVLAVLTAVLIPLFSEVSFADSVHRALVFLVISCPCALVISVPMTYFAGIGGAARRGIIYKSSSAVDKASEAVEVIFDKTGTLTSGKLRVTSVMGERMDPQTLLKIAAHAEAYSQHPLARAIVDAYHERLNMNLIQKFEEHPGKGVTVLVDKVQIAVGTAQFLRSWLVDIPDDAYSDEISVYMSIAGIYAGRITFGDDVKPDAAKAVHELEMEGCHVSMITGDTDNIAGKIAEQLEISEYYAACLPETKAEHIHNIRARSKTLGRTLFVGEGLNDAPALLSADMGIAMGVLGTDAAIEAADAVILDDKTTKVPAIIKGARRIRNIVAQNICIAIGIKLLILLFAVFGYAEMWMAVFADIGAALITILNAIRAMRVTASEK